MMINIKGNNPTELESIVQIVPEQGHYILLKQMKRLPMKQQK